MRMNRDQIPASLAGLRLVLAALAVAAGRLPAQTTESNVTWSGGAGTGNPYWNVPENWGGNESPANPTPGTIQFFLPGQDVVGKLEQDRMIGGLDPAPGTHLSPTPRHLLDLNGCTLTVTGDVGRDLCCRNWAFTFSNGTVRIGTLETSSRLLFGGNYQPQTLTFAPGMRVDTVNLLRIQSHSGSGSDTLDFRGVEWAGGKLSAGTIDLTGGARILVDTNLATLAVQTGLRLGIGHGSARCFIGDGTEKLPPGLDLTLGEDADHRAELSLGDVAGSANAQVLASTGGTVTAYLSMLRLGEANGTGSRGLFDMAGMDTCSIDTHQLRMGVDRAVPAAGDTQWGILRLPPGQLIAGNAVIGGATKGGAIIDLNGTAFIVTNAITLYPTAGITNRVGATPLGLDVQGTLNDNGGRIHLDFIAPPAVATNWGVRLNGSKAAVLGGMVGSGRLTWTTNTVAIPGKKVGVLTDGDYTYLAMVDQSVTLAPIASAYEELTFEMEPGGTVTVGIQDVDVGSYDQEGRPFTLRISEGARESDAALDFNEFKTYALTLTIAANGDTDADACSIGIVPIPPPTTANVRWTGNAPTALMDRREWRWGANWMNGVPPANPTPGTIEFFTLGQNVISQLDQDRVVGGVSTLAGTHLSPTPTHVVDLNGHTLTVNGPVGGNACCFNWTMTFSNGTVRIGSEQQAGRLLFGGSYQPQNLVFTPGTRLHAVNLSHIHSDSGLGTDTLDMRGVLWEGNRLRAGEIRLTSGGSSARIYIDESVAGSSLIVTQRLQLGNWTGNCYIGDPSEYKLASNMNLTIGTQASQRAEWVVFPGSHIIARSGGELNGWISNLDVGVFTQAGTAILDAGTMDGCNLDAVDVRIGVQDNGGGAVTLPPGEAVFDTLALGSAASGAGRLTLKTTRISVLSSVTINPTGILEVEIGDVSAGLDIRSDAVDALTFADGGIMKLQFTERAASKPHYGLRWAGNHVATVTAMRDAGKLVVDDAALGSRPAQILFYAGHTHVGLPPPSGISIQLR